MKNFNLLISTSRYNETEAKSELWFILLMCGDTYPIISGIQFPGLIVGFTNLDPKKVIAKINKILERTPNFFQYILKVVPIDFICETDPNTIKQIIQKNKKEFINKEESFRITLKRRKHEKIERNNVGCEYYQGEEKTPSEGLQPFSMNISGNDDWNLYEKNNQQGHQINEHHR